MFSKKLSLILVLGVLLAGCGIQQVAEDTRDQVRKSNDTQRQLLDEVARTRVLTEELLQSMGKQLALQEMFSAKNTAMLVPPLKMMPWGELFGQDASIEEIVRYCYLLLKHAESITPETKNDGMISLMGLSVIAGLAPEDKVAAILKSQVDGRGRFIDLAYAFALARYNFIRDFLLVEGVLKTRTLTIGALRDAVNYFTILKNIASLRYAGNLRIQVPSLDVDDKLLKGELVTIGKDARTLFEGQPGQDLNTPEAKELLKAFDVTGL